MVREYRRLPIGRFLIIAAARNFKAHRARFRFAVADVGLQIADFPFVAQPGGAHVYAAFDLQRLLIVRGGGKRRFALEIALRCANTIPSSIRCGQQIRNVGFDGAAVPAGFEARRIRNPNAVAHPHIVPENARPVRIVDLVANRTEGFGREPLLRVDIFNAKLFNAVDGFRPLGGMRLRKARIAPFEKFYRAVASERPSERQLLSVVIGLLQRKRRRSVGKLHRLTGILPVRHAVQLFIIGLRAARVALGLHSGKGGLKYSGRKADRGRHQNQYGGEHGDAPRVFEFAHIVLLSDRLKRALHAAFKACIHRRKRVVHPSVHGSIPPLIVLSKWFAPAAGGA